MPNRKSAKSFPKARDKSKDKRRAGNQGGKNSAAKRKKRGGTIRDSAYGGGQSMRLYEAAGSRQDKADPHDDEGQRRIRGIQEFDEVYGPDAGLK